MAVRQGRGSAATQALSLGYLVMCFFFLGAAATGAAPPPPYYVDPSATTYYVDWSFAADSWPSGKSFRTGDVLVFRYNSSVHNVMEVDADGYNGCQATGSVMAGAGDDIVVLGTGTNYYICSLHSHCGMGMRMAVTVQS